MVSADPVDQVPVPEPGPEPHDRVVERLRSTGCVFGEEEAALLREAAGDADELEALVEQRVRGLPLEQILGWAEFCGLRITVEPGVFVPRRRSEFLARSAAERTPPGAVVVDLCCGSGALAAAIDAAVGPVELHAADDDPVAVRCARRNLPDSADVHLGDLDSPLPARLVGRVAVLVAVAPYVPRDAVPLMPPEARLHEPRSALDGGDDGLDVVRRIAAVAPRWLCPGGHLLLEVGEPQAEDAVTTLVGCGLLAAVESDEETGATVVVGRRGSSSESSSSSDSRASTVARGGR